MTKKKFYKNKNETDLFRSPPFLPFSEAPMQAYMLTHTTYLEPNADTDREDGTWKKERYTLKH